MRKSSDEDEGLFGIGFSDTLISFLAIIFCMFVLINALPKNPQEELKSNINLGSICAEISWPDDRDVDLDLWGMSPEENVPIGYSNPHGPNLNLYRDVMGYSNNPSHKNVEYMCSNHTVPGEWTFNVSYFSDHQASNGSKGSPIEVRMTITFKDAKAKSIKSQLTGTYVLNPGQEKTMFDFRVDQTGSSIYDSVNSLDKPLRDKK